MAFINSNYIKIFILLLLGAGFVIYYYLFDPTGSEGPFFTCPSRTLLGINCPGCGSQRMIHSLLHLEFGKAFSYNPLLFITFPLVIILVWIFIANTFFGKAYRIALFYKNWFVLLLFALLILYGVLRNLPIEALSWLSPPQ